MIQIISCYIFPMEVPMFKNIFAVLLVSFACQSALATGMTRIISCTPVLKEEGDAKIRYVITENTAPGGPASSAVTVKIAKSREFRQISENLFERTFEDNLVVKMEPMQTPSGESSSFLFFL